MRVGQKCVACGRPMRPSKTRAADWPGTTAEGTSTMCTPCLQAHRKGRTLSGFRSKRPTHCASCGRPMRPRGTKLADYPGTISHGARDLCMSCYMARREGRPEATPRPKGVIPCRGCERPTRPSPALLADYPGTIPRARDGFCDRCLADGTAAPILAMAERTAAWRARTR